MRIVYLFSFNFIYLFFSFIFFFLIFLIVIFIIILMDGRDGHKLNEYAILSNEVKYKMQLATKFRACGIINISKYINSNSLLSSKNFDKESRSEAIFV